MSKHSAEYDIYDCDALNCNVQRIAEKDELPVGFHGTVTEVGDWGADGGDWFACKPEHIRGAVQAAARTSTQQMGEYEGDPHQCTASSWRGQSHKPYGPGDMNRCTLNAGEHEQHRDQFGNVFIINPHAKGGRGDPRIRILKQQRAAGQTSEGSL